MRVLFVIVLFTFFLPLYSFSQLSVLNREHGLFSEAAADSTHTLLRPYFIPTEKDSIYPGTWLKRKLVNEHVFVVRDSAKRYHFTIDPLVHFQAGKDMEDTLHKKLYQNSRGFVVRGRIGEDFSFETSFLESQGRFNSYVDSFAQLHGVIPGMGRWKSFDTTDYDFAASSGYFSWKACRYFSLTAGHGKHFVGEGYRSLLISDNAFNYPFMRLDHVWGKFRYTNVYAMLMNLHSGGVHIPPFTERLFQKKPITFHTLSWKPINRIELGLFQGMIWNVSDTLNQLKMGAGYFLPLLGVAPLMYDLNNEKNIWMGLNVNVEVLKGLNIYGQLVLDETGGRAELKKSGYQVGAKYRNAFTLKGLALQVEFNKVNPYTYAHQNVDQNISHYNQPLAHPLGAGFNEVVGLLDYQYKRFILHGAVSMAVWNSPIGGNTGGFIFFSDSTATVVGSGKEEILNVSGYTGLMINPAYQFQLVAGGRIRTMRSTEFDLPQNTMEFFVTLRTLLWNQYLDF